MKNKIVLIAIMFVILESCTFNGKLNGVITYFFNDNFGYKADVGANIFILKKSDFNNDSAQIIKNFFIHKNSYRYVMSDYKHKYITEKLTDYDDKQMQKADTIFEERSKIVFKCLINFRHKNNIQKIVADGNGSFSIDLPSNEYYVLVISKNRTSSNNAEILGQIDFKEIKIENGKQTFIDSKFEVE